MPDAAVEELVLPDRVLVRVPRPDQRHLRVAADRAVDPVGVRVGDPLEEIEDRRLPVLALDRLLGDPEVDEHEQRAGRARTGRHEQEEQAAPIERRRGRPSAGSGSRRTTARSTRAAGAPACRTRPAGRSASCTGATGSATAAATGATAISARPGHAALDPEHQRDQEERGDVEHVPLLDAERVHRGERRDLEDQPERQRDRGREERALGRGRPRMVNARTISAANGTTPSERISSSQW